MRKEGKKEEGKWRQRNKECYRKEGRKEMKNKRNKRNVMEREEFFWK